MEKSHFLRYTHIYGRGSHMYWLPMSLLFDPCPTEAVSWRWISRDSPTLLFKHLYSEARMDLLSHWMNPWQACVGIFSKSRIFLFVFKQGFLVLFQHIKTRGKSLEKMCTRFQILLVISVIPEIFQWFLWFLKIFQWFLWFLEIFHWFQWIQWFPWFYCVFLVLKMCFAVFFPTFRNFD